MGSNTDMLGEVAVDPPLNRSEIDYLKAFAQTRRWRRPAGPYVVSPPPHLDDPLDEDCPVDLYNRPSPGEPDLWCCWVPSSRGRRLTYHTVARSDRAAAWLRYLIGTFLGPGARASTSGEPAFGSFTFDHVLNGALAARRRDTGRLWLVRVDDNKVRERVVVRGGDEEEARSRADTSELAVRRARRNGRRASSARGDGVVVPLPVRSRHSRR